MLSKMYYNVQTISGGSKFEVMLGSNNTQVLVVQLCKILVNDLQLLRYKDKMSCQY